MGYHTPVHTPQLLLCESCWLLDVGQEDWLIQYTEMELGSDAMRQELRELNEDANVCGVVPQPTTPSRTTRLGPPSPPLWAVQFNTGAREPAYQQLAERVRARRTRHLREDPVSATEEALIDLWREQHTELDLSPGSVLRSLVIHTAAVINQLQSQNLEQARQQITDRLTTDGFVGVAGTTVDAMAQHALEAQAQSREALVREAINSEEGRVRLARAMIQPIRDRLAFEREVRHQTPVAQLGGSYLPDSVRLPDPEVSQQIADMLGTVVPSASLISNVGKQWVTSANPDVEVNVEQRVVRTRWQRLLDEDPY